MGIFIFLFHSLPHNIHDYATGFLPWMTRTKNTTIAITSNTCIYHPMVYTPITPITIKLTGLHR
jgi:hypothetical protein